MRPVTPSSPVAASPRRSLFVAAALAGSLFAASASAAPNLPNPVMFVTQVPVPSDFATIGSVFANHMADMDSAARGGDLWIRYPNGNLRNLTAAMQHVYISDENYEVAGRARIAEIAAGRS